ncbi:LysR family transcriptional regulator [Rhodococcus sp. D2-41]|uniref:LysR family transcriptional regulator n=1 Tax=Speluncibacter jeojiensis TaxID=2710754 RepID=UPI00240FCB33|nr:LysR family transcriptional regulator [Rhodococcus sp. D2-41]MDG3008564.1 LysR family transcriptional regulator [Rhodococcus sp. D2-41]
MLSDDLHWFLTLAEHGQVTSAARELHLSQPTLTRMLQRLERDLGAQLFDRHGRRIALNPCGEVLHRHARRALDELTAAREEITALVSPDRGTVRLDFLHSFGTWLVPTLIKDFHRDRPGIEFRLFQGAQGLLANRVLEGRSDLALVSPRPVVDGLDWHVLTQQQLALAVPRGHRFARRRRMRLREVADEPLITMHPNFGMRRILDELCAAAGFEPNVTFESAELTTIGGLVSAGLGVAVMPVQRHQPAPDGVTLVPLSDPDATRDIGAVWRTDRTHPEPVRLFAQFVAGWGRD